MNLEQMDRQIADIASSLGDTTRRGIFISVRESADPMTASQIAALFDIHPNVARHHLDRLVSDGYLRVTHRRPEGRSGPGAGRPAKHYEPTDKSISLQFPARRYDLLIDLLVRVIERLAPEDAPEVVEEIGTEYGREIAAELGLPDDAGYEAAALAVAKAMTGVGFEIEADADGRRLLTKYCPFGEAAKAHPHLVCRLDQGIVKGLLEAGRQRPVAVVMPHAEGDDHCVTEL